VAADFRRAFAGPAAFWDAEREERIATEVRGVGDLSLPTGQLAIHDPGYEFAPDPLDRSVPAGSHPVDLLLRTWRNPDGEIGPPLLIAAVRLVAGPGDVDRYVPVLSATRGAALDIGVDSGLVAIFDRATLPALLGVAILDAVPDSGPDYPPGVVPAHIVPGPRGGIFASTAGMGDGAYRAWWGEGADGELRELIVDFGLLEHSLWRTVERPASILLESAARIRLALAGTGVELEPVPMDSIEVSLPWAPTDAQLAFRRPPGPVWEMSLQAADGAWVAGPGLVQVVPGPWYEIFDRGQVEGAATLRIRIHEGRVPDQPLEE
jgi:hypothetical protein